MTRASAGLFAVEPPRSGLMNTLWEKQLEKGFISDSDIAEMAAAHQTSKVDIEGVASFYHFFHRTPAGKYTIYIDDSIIARHKGYGRIVEAFERETGAMLGSVDRTGTFGLFKTPCIGLSDQAPAVLINFLPFTHLNVIKVKEIVQRLKNGEPLESLYHEPDANVRQTLSNGSSVFFDAFQESTFNKIADLSPEAVIEQLKACELSGRGGAFYPTWKKWDACRRVPSTLKFIVCNADEGEPGTFKDRVLLHQSPELLLQGMILAGYTAGAQYGFIYLRGEYWWLYPLFQKTIEDFRQKNYLGGQVLGIDGFAFDIRIQMGAGAYVCGEETALLESMEGKRGEPRTKWFFPVEKGYLQQPTIVNNVETFCAAASILRMGTDAYNRIGLPGSPGAKLISISGDCALPGVYEIPWGMTVAELLERCGAEDPYFIQVSGPSGECISMQEKYRRISMLDLLGARDIRCGGSFMVFNSKREIIDILLNFAEFFKKESCGICTPCRAGNFMLQRKLEKFKHKMAHPSDIEELRHWGLLMKTSSRCGLGKTACNSVLFAAEKFAPYFQTLLDREYDGLNSRFDMEQAIADYEVYKPD